MSQAISKRLLNLLPELYRWRDEQQGDPLQAFLSIFEYELHRLEEDMEAMYDNWFIQTSDNWVVPYLADLLGIRDEIVQIDYLPFTQRRRVANTLAYRRRKGTVGVLEQVLWDVTNWHVRAVEFYRLLGATQHLQHLQADQVVTVNLQDMAGLAALESPFSMLPRGGDMRTASAGHKQVEPATDQQPTPRQAERTTGGKYNPQNLGLFFWRLRPYPVNRGFPKPYVRENSQQIDQKTRDCYFTFSPTGHDTQLFNRPQSYQALVQRATAVNMPVLVTRSVLAADLKQYKTQYKDMPLAERPLNSTYYGTDRCFAITDIREIQLFDFETTLAFQTNLNQGILVDGVRQNFVNNGISLSQNISVRTVVRDKRWQLDDPDLAKSYRISLQEKCLQVSRNREQISPSDVISVDLSAWPALTALRATFADADHPNLVAVDPELGRIAFLNEDIELGAHDIRVDYTYGFSSDVGGGPYPRHFALPNTWESYCEILVAIGCENSKMDEVSAQSKVLVASSLAYALALWNHYCTKVDDKPRGLIRMLDNGIYDMGVEADGEWETAIRLPKGAELSIVAEDGVQPTIVGHNAQLAITFQLPVPPIARAAALMLEAEIVVEEAPVVDRKLLLSGLRIVGELRIEEVGMATINALDLVVEHCSILQGGITVDLETENAPALALTVRRAIVGPLRIPANVAGLYIAESIIDHQLAAPTAAASELRDYALAAPGRIDDPTVRPGPEAIIEQCTIFGQVYVAASLQANAVLFTSAVKVETQAGVAPGVARYCYLPIGSWIPVCEHCLYEGDSPSHCLHCRAQIARPVFSSRRYGRPGYAQLSKLSGDEIRYGVGDIAEIGVFHHLYQPQRAANIQIMLEEFLPLGLDAGIFHVT